MADNLKQKAVNSVAWSAIDRVTSQGIQFVFNILIARILLPEDYGVVALLNVFLAIAQTFVDSGFGNALIRKLDRTEEDFNTVFYFNVLVSCLFFVVLWCIAPAISGFYETPILTKITRIVSVTVIINALGAIQNTKLSIDINFKTKAIISIISVMAIGSVGLYMAYNGYGIWTLVAQSLVASVVRTGLSWLFVRWRPRLLFSWASFKDLFSFGSKLLASGLIDTIWGNLYNIVIGKVINPTALGLYNRANSFATFPSANIYGMVQGVSYPVLCSIQNDHERLRESFRKFIRLFAYVVFPLMIGLASVADPFIRVVLKDAWLDVVPLLRILCFSLMWYPLGAMNTTFPNVLGRSDYYLRLVVFSMIMNAIALVITIPLGLRAMCYGQIVTAILGYAVCSHYVAKLINYNFLNQMRDVAPSLLLSLTMGLFVYGLTRIIYAPIAQLGVGILSGMLYYYIMSRVFKVKELDYLIDIIREKLSV